MGENGGAKSISLFQKIISHTIPDLNCVDKSGTFYLHIKLSCLIMTSCQPQLHILLQEHAKPHKKGVFHKNILELAFRGFPNDLHDKEF